MRTRHWKNQKKPSQFMILSGKHEIGVSGLRFADNYLWQHEKHQTLWKQIIDRLLYSFKPESCFKQHSFEINKWASEC